MGKPTILRFFFIIAILLSPDRVHAQTGLFLDDFGASCKSIAVGQAFTAVADDFSAAYYNPAGLTQAESNFEVTLGYYYAKPMAKARMEYGPYRYDDDLTIQISGQRSSRGAIIGIASDLDFDSVIEAFPLFQRFAFGMVFWLNLPEIMTYHTGPEAYRAHYLRWDAGFALLSIVNSMACEITPWLSIGAGAIVSQKVFTQEHNMSAANKSTFFPIPGIVPDEVIGTRVSVWSKAEAFAIPLAGILVKPPIRSLQDKISLGITWRKGQKVHHGRGTQRIGFGWENDDGSFDWYLYLNDGLKTAIVGWQPTQITGSLAVRPIKGLVVSTDLTWKDWSKYEDYLGLRPSPRFKDTYVPRVGVEYAFDPDLPSRWLRWLELIAIRAGYFFEPSPIPDDDDIYHRNIFDTDTDVISTGLQFDYSSWGGWLEHSVEAYYQIHLLRKTYLPKDEDLWFGPTRLSGQVWSFGVSITTRF